MTITIYHNPACGTSRNTLDLKQPPSRETLVQMIAAAGLTPATAIRAKEKLVAELGLDKPDVTEATLIDAMLAHPILINRPFVVTPRGTRLCRPSELVLDILPAAQQGGFVKEDGEIVIDTQGQRVKSST